MLFVGFVLGIRPDQRRTTYPSTDFALRAALAASASSLVAKLPQRSLFIGGSTTRSTVPPTIFSKRFCSDRAASALEIATSWMAQVPPVLAAGAGVGVGDGFVEDAVAGAGGGAGAVVTVSLVGRLESVSCTAGAGAGRHG